MVHRAGGIRAHVLPLDLVIGGYQCHHRYSIWSADRAHRCPAGVGLTQWKQQCGCCGCFREGVLAARGRRSITVISSYFINGTRLSTGFPNSVNGNPTLHGAHTTIKTSCAPYLVGHPSLCLRTVSRSEWKARLHWGEGGATS